MPVKFEFQRFYMVNLRSILNEVENRKKKKYLKELLIVFLNYFQ